MEAFVRGNDAQLAAFSDRVGLRHEPDRFPSGFTVPEQAKTDRSVAGVPQGLAGDGSDSRLGVGNDASHGDELGLDGDPKLAGAWVAGDDGKGRNAGFPAASSGQGSSPARGMRMRNLVTIRLDPKAKTLKFNFFAWEPA